MTHERESRTSYDSLKNRDYGPKWSRSEEWGKGTPGGREKRLCEVTFPQLGPLEHCVD